MSFEGDINQSTRQIVEHIQRTCAKNITEAVLSGKLTIEREKLPGLHLLIKQSIETGYRQSSEGLNQVLKKYSKKIK